MKKVASNRFKDKVLVYWTIIYDNDLNKMYSFDDFDKVLASVEASVRGYICDDNFDMMFYDIVDKIEDQRESPVICIRVNNLDINIYRWELDDAQKIHKVLCECYDNIIDDNLRDKIRNLFYSSSI